MTSTEKYLLMMRRRFTDELNTTLSRLRKDPNTSHLLDRDLEKLLRQSIIRELRERASYENK